VGLEALTQEAAPGVAARLAALLPAAPDRDDYRRQLLLALLRLRHRAALDAATAYVTAGLRDGRPEVLTVLAAVARVDAGRALDLGAACFAASLGAAPAAVPGVEGHVPAVASTFLAAGDALLPQLVARTRASDAAAGAALSALLDAYLARPWVLADLGAPRAQALRRAVAAAGA
jgi:hypothetical protein